MFGYPEICEKRIEKATNEGCGGKALSHIRAAFDEGMSYALCRAAEDFARRQRNEPAPEPVKRECILCRKTFTAKWLVIDHTLICDSCARKYNV